jgi:hypothetical protein
MSREIRRIRGFAGVPSIVRCVACGIFVAGALPAASHAQLTNVIQTHPVIVTSGSSTIHLAPDRATVNINVETRASSASEAARVNATATTATIAALRAAGLTPAQLSTSGFSVMQDYTRLYMQSAAASVQPAGFVATNGVRADVESIGMLSKLIDAALAAGANQIRQIQFSSSGSEQAKLTALAQAFANAHANAEAIARAAGGSLGPMVEVTAMDPGSTFFSVMVPVQIRGVAGGTLTPPPTPLAAGDVPVTASVTARWSFLPAH